MQPVASFSLSLAGRMRRRFLGALPGAIAGSIAAARGQAPEDVLHVLAGESIDRLVLYQVVQYSLDVRTCS